MANDKQITLRDVVNIVYASADTAAFENRDGFLALKITLPYTPPEEEPNKEDKEDKPEDAKNDAKPDEAAETNTDKAASEGDKPDEKKEPPKKPDPVVTPNGDGSALYDYSRIFLQRAFPFENPYEYISVLDSEGKEVCLIHKLDELREQDRPLIVDELERKYYTPVISKITSMNERFGFSYWTVTTDTGERSFTMQDTYRNISRVSSTHVFLTDVDGNRYDIPDIEALDRKSYRKLELYI